MLTNKLVPEITQEHITKYNMRVPRYTSYPTVPNWDNNYGIDNHLQDLQEISQDNGNLSLYFHIPFCIRRCLFCACNVLVTKRKDRVNRYINFLKLEIAKTAELLDGRHETIQLHFGGGTPTHLEPLLLRELLTTIHEYFEFVPESEKSIEIHPSVTTLEHIDVLEEFGFNRLSVGVQDLNPVVQKKLNRFQTYEETAEIITYARQHGFKGINIDLIYGLPFQTHEGLDDTVSKMLGLKPDRVALYSFAHFPTIIPHHKQIPLEVIPQGSHKFDLFLETRAKFLSNGYEQIGFDHFARPTDELYESYLNKTLRRNFMGYTTKSGTDLLAFGYSGISELSNSYGQNSKDMNEYEVMIAKYGRAVIKGHHMTEEDKIRKELIMNFLCQGEYQIELEDTNPIRARIHERVTHLFSSFEKAGFIDQFGDKYRTTPLGNILARVVASSFDAYFDPEKHLFSQSI